MKVGVFGILFSFCIAVNAQTNVSDSVKVNPNAPIENWTVRSAPKFYKFSPLDIFSVIPSFGLDVETKLKSGDKSLQLGLAYIPDAFQIISSEVFNGYDWMGGYKVRGEGRIYMPNKTNNYLSFGASVRHLVIKDEVAIGMEGVEGQFGETIFAYFINTPMTFNRFTIDFSVKYGYQVVQTSGFVLDFYAGLNLRSLRVYSNSKIPEGGELPIQRGMWQLEDGKKLSYPLPVIGLKIGFRR